MLQGSVHHRSQDTEVPGEDAWVILDAVVLLPAVGGVEGVDGAGEEDGGVGLHLHLFGGRPAQLQSCGDKEKLHCPVRFSSMDGTAKVDYLNLRHRAKDVISDHNDRSPKLSSAAPTECTLRAKS